MNCKHCGSFIENEEANVCPFCGKELNETDVVEETIELRTDNELEASKEEEYVDDLEDEYYEEDEENQETLVEEKKSNKKTGVIIALVAAVLLIACLVVVLMLTMKDKNGSKNISYKMSDGTVVGDYKTNTAFIDELAEYHGVKVNMKPDVVTDEDVEQEMNSALLDTVTTSDVTDRDVAQDGDVVTIDFTGYHNGEAFDHGSATNHTLQIGAGGYVDGFESGIIGHKIGETFEVNVTFPESYQDDTLAGEDVVFEMTLHAIKESVVPELNDTWVSENTDYKTLDEYRQSVRADLEERALNSVKATKSQRILEQIYDATIFSSYPKEQIEQSVAMVKQYYEMQASYMNMTLEDMLKVIQMSGEDFDEMVEKVAKRSVGTRIVCFAIAEKEGIKISEEEYTKEATESAPSMGFSSLEEYENAATKQSIYDSLIIKKVTDLVTEQAIEVDEPVTSSEE